MASEESMVVYRKLYPVQFYERFLEQQVRPDGRMLEQARVMSIGTGSIGSAYGSSVSKLGNTSVVAGVQAELSMYDPNVSSQLVINVEMGGICGEPFGKPSAATQSICARLNELAAQMKLIQNLDSLYLNVEDEPGAKTERKKSSYLWYIIVDLYCVENDGSVFEACLLAMIAALKNTRIPNVVVEDEKLVEVDGDEGIKLEIAERYPISLSFILYKGHLLVDTSYGEEEHLGPNAFNVVLCSDGTLCSIHKPGGAPLSTSVMQQCLRIARAYAVSVDEVIRNSLVSVKF